MHHALSRARFRRCAVTTGNDAMTANQVTTFQAGSGVTPGNLLLAIASIVLTLAIVWAAWISLGGRLGVDIHWSPIGSESGFATSISATKSRT